MLIPLKKSLTTLLICPSSKSEWRKIFLVLPFCLRYPYWSFKVNLVNFLKVAQLLNQNREKYFLCYLFVSDIHIGPLKSALVTLSPLGILPNRILLGDARRYLKIYIERYRINRNLDQKSERILDIRVIQVLFQEKSRVSSIGFLWKAQPRNLTPRPIIRLQQIPSYSCSGTWCNV